jgi:hypothetical protein
VARLLQQNVSASKLFEFEHDFFTLIQQVQSSTDFIDPDMDGRDAFDIIKSLRRGFTSFIKKKHGFAG